MTTEISTDTDSPAHAPVVVIGLGAMGRALAGKLLGAGHPTTVWNRSPDKARPLAERGARPADSIEGALQAAPLVITCLTSTDVVADLLDQVTTSLSGRTLINLSSGTSAAAGRLAGWADRHDGAFLDGAILASPGEIGEPDATIVYSGPESLLRPHAATLHRLAGTLTHLGDDHRLAALVEAAGLGLMWGALDGFLYGTALITAAGSRAETFAPLAAAELRIIAGWLEGYANQVDAADYPSLDGTLDVHRAAMANLLAESEALGLDPALPRLIKEVADRAAAAGHGEHGFAVQVDQFRAARALNPPPAP